MDQVHHFLPPNLNPNREKKYIHAFVISVKQIIYLQSSTTPSIIKYKWWGLGKNKTQNSLKEQSTFFLTVSVQMFLRYCFDMKVLEVELCDRNGACVAKLCLNWSLLGPWKGEEVELMLDAKSSKGLKMGQIRMGLKITQVQNPLLKKSMENDDGQNNQETMYIRRTKQKNVERRNVQDERQISVINKKDKNFSIPQKQFYDKENGDNFLSYKINYFEDEPTRKQAVRGIHSQQMQFRSPDTVEIRKSPTQIKAALFQRLNIPISDQCICQELKGNNYAKQKIQLRGEVDLFFLDSLHNKTYEELVIKLIGWQPFDSKDKSLSCKVSVPLLEESGVFVNQYYLSKSKGQIKLRIQYNSNEGRIKKYLSENAISLRVGQFYFGSIELYKLIGSRQQIVSVTMIENRNRKQTIKGHCLLKAVEDKLKQEKGQEKKRGLEQNQQQVPKSLHRVTDLYSWIYVRQLHFLEPQLWAQSNIFLTVKFLQSEKPEYTTKTVWDSFAPFFNEIITIRKLETSVMVEVFNRKSSQWLIGRGVIDLSKSEFTIQVPFYDKRKKVIGYINICTGEGDINSATKFLNTHSSCTRSRRKSELKREEKNETKDEVEKKDQDRKSNKSKQKEEDQDMQSMKRSKQKELERDQENSQQQQASLYEQNSYSQKREIFQQPSILESHNLIFTKYLSNSFDWLETYSKSYVSIAEFSFLLKPICELSKFNKFLSTYLQPERNMIQLLHVKESFQAFKVYYHILSDERDECLIRFIKTLQQEGISLNYLESSLSFSYKQRNDKETMWKGLKRLLPQKQVQNLRYFYEENSIQEICDSVRKFQVFESTKGELVDINLIERRIVKQTYELLEIDVGSPKIRSVIKDSQIQLSKFELLCIFGNLQAPTKMVKSPTFGFLQTDRIMNLEKKIAPNQNSSLQLRLDQNNNISSLSGISQKFGNPTISPIHNTNLKGGFEQVILRIKDVEHYCKSIKINDQTFNLSWQGNGEIRLGLKKQFLYQGYILTGNNQKLIYEGPSGEWVSLVDEEGDYCGCVLFQ